MLGYCLDTATAGDCERNRLDLDFFLGDLLTCVVAGQYVSQCIDSLGRLHQLKRLRVKRFHFLFWSNTPPLSDFEFFHDEFLICILAG